MENEKQEKTGKQLGYQFFQSKEEAEQLFDKIKQAAAFNKRVYLIHENKDDVKNLQADLYRILHAMLTPKNLRVILNKKTISIYDKMTPVTILNFEVNKPNAMRGIDKEQIVEV